jgi:hypothetical protein
MISSFTHFVLWFYKNPRFLISTNLWKHVYMFQNDKRYECSRKYCICKENIIYQFLGAIENKKPIVSKMKPILRHQKQCKYAFNHFSSPNHY